MKVNHKTVYMDENKVAVHIPFVPEMKRVCPDASFPLLDDPQKSKSTLMIGMFVLRAAYEQWNTPLIKNDGSFSIYDVNKWIYNIDTATGGGIIAHGNLMDGFRLGLQYGISDAVIVGSNTIANDGLPQANGTPGYVWMPYGCASWPHLQEAVPDMMDIILKQRQEFQKAGYASSRTYPAQIAVSRSGTTSSGDLLSASIFHEKLPDGEAIESYIITSETGARRLRKRASELKMEDRIEKILIVHSPAAEPDQIDLESLPQKLYSDYDIRIANHDGGALILRAFCKAGIVGQFNFTFARGESLREAVETSRIVPENERAQLIKDFDKVTAQVFSNPEGKLPGEISLAQIIQDEDDEAVVAVLDTREIRNF